MLSSMGLGVGMGLDLEKDMGLQKGTGICIMGMGMGVDVDEDGALCTDVGVVVDTEDKLIFLDPVGYERRICLDLR